VAPAETPGAQAQRARIDAFPAIHGTRRELAELTM
jgi:hypothetical protein